jgi:mevalonate kinase
MNSILTAVENIVIEAIELFKSYGIALNFIILRPLGNDKIDSTMFERDLNLLIEMNHLMMASCGVSHEKLEVIRSLSVKHFISTKLTGAGGGGCALSFVPPTVDSRGYEKDLTEAGFMYYKASLGCPGVSAFQIK